MRVRVRMFGLIVHPAAKKRKTLKALRRDSGDDRWLKRSSDKKHRHEALAQVVNVVSSIGIGQAFKTHFEAKLNAAGAHITPTYYPHLDYGSGLANQIRQFNNGLLVTLGGLVSFVASVASAQVKFISLIGGTPQINGNRFPTPSNGSTFWGAVSLESYAGNAQRIRYLGRAPHNYQTSQISLLYNPNSFMANVEVQNWPNSNVQPGGVDPNGNNSAQYYAAAFQNIATQAVVISADPYFQHTKDDLVAAANASGQYICYPLYNYQNSNPPPEPHGATLYGPKLEDAIDSLGTMARDVLTKNQANPNIELVPLGSPRDL